MQLFWGHADLGVTRFSGQPCTPPPGAGMLEREAYDYEQMSIGWWPGDASFPKPPSTRTRYPKPDGIEQAELGIAGAAWDTDLGEFILDYDDVRAAPSPKARSARVPRRRLRSLRGPRGW